MISNFTTSMYAHRNGGQVVTIETRAGILIAEGVGPDQAAAVADLASQVVLHTCACGRELCSPIGKVEPECVTCTVTRQKATPTKAFLMADIRPTAPARPRRTSLPADQVAALRALKARL